MYFTDHMAVATWTAADGWHDSAIVPYGPFTLDPATAVLHYAQEIFEGLKAYRHEDGSIWTFRADRNAERMVRSASGSLFRACLRMTSSAALKSWSLPTSPGCQRHLSRACICGRSCSPQRHFSEFAPRSESPTAASPARPAPTSPPG